MSEDGGVSGVKVGVVVGKKDSEEVTEKDLRYQGNGEGKERESRSCVSVLP